MKKKAILKQLNTLSINVNERLTALKKWIDKKKLAEVKAHLTPERVEFSDSHVDSIAEKIQADKSEYGEWLKMTEDKYNKLLAENERLKEALEFAKEKVMSNMNQWKYDDLKEIEAIEKGKE